jgi:hypothetical protein
VKLSHIVIAYRLSRLEHEQREQRKQINFILREIGLHPDTLSVTLTTGDKPLNLSQQVTASAIETSSKTGNSFPFANLALLAFVSANLAIATVSANGDGTATVTPVAIGTTTITCTDSANGLSGSVDATVTAVIADQPDTLTVTLSPAFPFGTSGNAPKPPAA